jgi:hypothetical protein
MQENKNDSPWNAVYKNLEIIATSIIIRSIQFGITTFFITNLWNKGIRVLNPNKLPLVTYMFVFSVLATLFFLTAFIFNIILDTASNRITNLLYLNKQINEKNDKNEKQDV